MRATVKAFSFFLVGALAFIAVLTPTTVEAQEVELDLDVCLALEAAAIIDGEGNLSIDVDLDTIIDAMVDLDLGSPLEVTAAATLVLGGGCVGILADAPASGFMTISVFDVDGSIIPGATVNFPDIGESGTVAPNDGSFTTSTTYAPGIYAFTASAPGYESFDGSVEIVNGNAGTTVNLPFAAEVPESGFMTVSVFDAEGNIIPGATVNFPGIGEGGTVAPNDGSFTTNLEYVPGTYAFTASAPGYVSIDGSVTIVDGNAGTTVNLAAEPVPADGFMTVVVQDAEGNIIPDATVTFADIDESGTVYPNDGSFTTDLEYAPGTYAFTASAPGYETLDGSVTIVDGNAGTTVNLTAEPAPGSGYMTIIVQDADGNIIPGATVDFADIDESGTVYPNDGSFTTSTVYAPDTYEFTASAAGYESVVDSVVVVEGNASTTVNLAAVPAEPEPGIVTINISSADPNVANAMPEGAAWTVSDGDFTLGAVFAEGDLTLPTTIVPNNPVPGGTNTVTVNAEPAFEMYTVEVFVDGDTSVDVVLTPVAAEPDVATVNAAAYACEGLTAPGLLTDIGEDCTPVSTSFDFYLSGDGTDVPAYTVPVDGSASFDVQVGTYEVWAADGTLFDLIVPAEGTSFAYGYPAAAPVETGTVTASVFHCLALETPGMLTDVGDDCIPGPAAFDFYLIGDGTDDSWRLTVGEDGVNSISLAVGEYEVYEVSTDTRLDNVVVTAGQNSAFSFGIPRVEAPPTTTGILSVSTYICEDLDEAVVLGEIGDDCVRTSTNLSFYLWGDGTDQNWPLTTSATGPVDHELPIGSYEVIDEATQWTFAATVVEEGSEIAFGIPASAAAPVDPAPEPTDPPADPSDPKDPPVTGLPETGTGTSSNVGALGALVSGALLAAGALGVRIRKS